VRTKDQALGGKSSSTERWDDVPRGMMDEVSSYVRLDPPSARPPQRLVRIVLESHDGRALVPIPKRSTSPRATSTLWWRIV
jgi:hypothetical protein